MRIIACRERPHPGAQLRITDAYGWRITIFAANVPDGRSADHELTHRLQARAEDRIRCLKDAGLRNLDPVPGSDWYRGTGLGTQTTCLRLLTLAGHIVRTGRRTLLRLPRAWPWARLILTGHHRLAAHGP